MFSPDMYHSRSQEAAVTTTNNPPLLKLIFQWGNTKEPPPNKLKCLIQHLTEPCLKMYH